MADLVRLSSSGQPIGMKGDTMGTLIKRIVGGIIIAKLVGKFTGRNRKNEVQ